MIKPIYKTSGNLRILLSVVLVSLFSYARSQEQKRFSWLLGAGSVYVYDEYLSPLSHTGFSIFLSTDYIKPLKWGVVDEPNVAFENGKWFNQFVFSMNPSYVSSKAGTNIWHGNLELRNNILREVPVGPAWNIAAGGFTAITFGGRYCSDNGNNPGSLDLGLDVGATFSAEYGFTLLHRKVTLSYQGSLALAGLSFSPEYAESYYEIFYLGNTENVVQVTHPFNRQRWWQQWRFVLPAEGRKSGWQLSYWNEGDVRLLNNIRTRVLSNYFTVGYVRYFHVL